MRLPILKKIFAFLVIFSLFSVFALLRDLGFPYITSKVLVFRSIILLTLPIYLLLVISQKELRPNFKNPISAAALAFFAISLVAGIFGINLNRSFWGNFERMTGIFYLFHLTLLYFYIQALGKISSRWLQLFLKLLVGVGTLAAVYGILSKLGLGFGLYPDDSLPTRVSSITGNPIFFASLLILPVFLALFFAFQAETKNEKYFWSAGFFLQLIGIYLSATRGAFLGLAAGFVVGFFALVLLAKSAKLRLYGLSVIAAMFAVLLVLVAVSSRLPQGSTIRRLTDFYDSNTQARLVQWGMSIKGYKDHPILGVGPENYYAISNKYFNPAMYAYDRSWFDKPHNYLLEVLLTTGSLGFLAYASLIGFSVYACWRAFKAGLLSSWEFCVLLAGVVAYQVQNLFVFDTVGASMAFFAFLGFTGYLWQESAGARHSGSHEKKHSGLLTDTQKFGAAFVAVAVIYLIYVTNILPGKATAYVNDGVGNQENNPNIAKEAFDKAMAAPMNFDYSESATRYEEFASQLVLMDLNPKDKPAIIDIAQGAEAALDKAIARTGNDPILWFKLTNMESTIMHLKGDPYDDKIEKSAQRAVDLAPSRVETRYFLVQAYQVKKDYASAEEQQKQVIKIDYDNPFNFWRLALVYREAGDMGRAYQLAIYARQNGYEFRNLAESEWLAQYYSDFNQFGEMAKIYRELIKNGLANFQTYANLATVYAKLGERDLARQTALKVLDLNPNAKPDVDAFLQKLDSGASF